MIIQQNKVCANRCSFYKKKMLTVALNEVGSSLCLQAAVHLPYTWTNCYSRWPDLLILGHLLLCGDGCTIVARSQQQRSSRRKYLQLVCQLELWFSLLVFLDRHYRDLVCQVSTEGQGRLYISQIEIWNGIEETCQP